MVKSVALHFLYTKAGLCPLSQLIREVSLEDLKILCLCTAQDIINVFSPNRHVLRIYFFIVLNVYSENMVCHQRSELFSAFSEAVI